MEKHAKKKWDTTAALLLSSTQKISSQHGSVGNKGHVIWVEILWNPFLITVSTMENNSLQKKAFGNKTSQLLAIMKAMIIMGTSTTTE